MRLKAFAKVNLTLDVTGRREDGYHLIDSVMQSVSLYDTVALEKAPEIEVTASVNELCGENNIAFRAAKIFFREIGSADGARIHIEKNIPYPAGLGGGSADAAAVFVGLNALYGAGLTENQLRELSLKAGADVPFCISGGTARVGGIGEKIAAMPPIEGLWLVIAAAGEKKSTAEMYSRLDAAPVLSAYTEEFIGRQENGGTAGALPYCKNAFSFAYSESEVFGELKKSGALAVSLSGSGPSAFGIFENKKAAELAAKRLCGRGIRAYTAESRRRGVIIE